MSKLERELKAIVRDQTKADVRFNSPSGPFVRAVLWRAGEREQILGQAFWDTTHDRWVVRAVDLEAGDHTLVIEHPGCMNDLAESIDRVIDRVQNPALAALDTVAPELADIVRSLRERD